MFFLFIPQKDLRWKKGVSFTGLRVLCVCLKNVLRSGEKRVLRVVRVKECPPLRFNRPALPKHGRNGSRVWGR